MIEELNKIKYKIESLKKYKIQFNNELETLTDKNVELNNQLAEVLEEREYYRKAVDVVYERSVKELEDILNSALNTIYSDRDFNIKIELTDKRGKSLVFKATEKGNPVNLKKGTGMGEKTVISAILHMYYLQCKNSKILMLDEAYSAVSDEYTDAFFQFLEQMCKKLGFTIVLITHDRRYLNYGDKHYKINQGVVSE